MRTPILASALVAIAPVAAFAQQVTSFDIVGVRLAMSPLQAEAAVRAKGYRVEQIDRGMDFRQRVQDVLAARDPWFARVDWKARVSPLKMTAVGPSNERLTVTFAPLPGGTVVREVRLEPDRQRTERAMLAAQVFARYGRATERYDTTSYWCAEGRRTCWRDVGNARRPMLSFNDFAFQTLVLADPAASDVRVEELIAAEVERRMPKRPAAF